MNPDKPLHPLPERADKPTGEQMAAYVDGELDDMDRRSVEFWLALHPEAAAEIEVQIRLAKLWRTTLPVEPGEAKWMAALTNIEKAIVVAKRRRQWRLGLTWFLGTAAIALVLYLGGIRNRPGADGEDKEPFPVATTEDVEINSLDDADRAVLVVGDLPARGPIDLVGPGDVVVKSIQPDKDGMVPAVPPVPERSASPIIVVPITLQQAKEHPTP